MLVFSIQSRWTFNMYISISINMMMRNTTIIIYQKTTIMVYITSFLYIDEIKMFFFWIRRKFIIVWSLLVFSWRLERNARNLSLYPIVLLQYVTCAMDGISNKSVWCVDISLLFYCHCHSCGYWLWSEYWMEMEITIKKCMSRKMIFILWWYFYFFHRESERIQTKFGNTQTL